MTMRYITKQVKQFLLTTLFFMTLASIHQGAAFAQTAITFQQAAVKIKANDTKFISLDKGYYLDRISFEARKSVFACDDTKLLLTIDGHHNVAVNVSKTGWRTYTASFSDFTKMVEIKNISENGFIKVRNITVLPRRIQTPGPGYDYIPSGSDVYYQVAFIKNTVDYLYHVVDQDARTQYLDPFVVVLGNAMAILETSSDLSNTARMAVEDIDTYMDNMAPFLDSLLQVPTLSDLARELKSSHRLLKKMLQN